MAFCVEWELVYDHSMKAGIWIDSSIIIVPSLGNKNHPVILSSYEYKLCFTKNRKTNNQKQLFTKIVNLSSFNKRIVKTNMYIEKTASEKLEAV